MPIFIGLITIVVLACMTAAAHAMPQFIPLFLTTTVGLAVAAGGLTAGVLGGAALITGISIVAGSLQRRNRASTGAQPLAERKVPVRLSDAPRKVVYGLASYAPALVSAHSYGTLGNRAIVLVYALADHNLERIDAIDVGGGSLLTQEELQVLTALHHTEFGGASDETGDFRNRAVESKNIAGNVGFQRVFIPGLGVANIPVGSNTLGEVFLGLSASGDFAEIMDASSINPPDDAPTWSSLDMKATGVAWMAVVLYNAHLDTNPRIFNSLPAISVRAYRALEDVRLVGPEYFDTNEISEYSGYTAGDITNNGVRYTGYNFGLDDTGEVETATAASGSVGTSVIEGRLTGGLGVVQTYDAASPKMRIAMPRQFFLDLFFFQRQTRPCIRVTSDDDGDVIVEANLYENFTRQIQVYISAPNVVNRLIRNGERFSVEIFQDNAIRSGDNEFGVNTATAVLDYLEKYTPYGTPVFSQSRIDLDSIVATHATIPRCNGVIELTTAAGDNLTSLVQAADGADLVEFGGTVRLRAGIWREPSATLNEDDILDYSIAPELPRDDRYDGISVQYADTNGEVQAVEALLPNVVAKTGRVIEAETSMINNDRQARIFANFALLRVTQGFSLRITTGARGVGLQPGDNVYLDFPTFGIRNKTFRVVSSSIGTGVTAELTLVENDPSFYAGISDTAYIPPNYEPFDGTIA